jgi:hypothetical protein
MVRKGYTMISCPPWKMEELTKENGMVAYFGLHYRLKKVKVKDGVGIMFWPDGTKYEG